MPKLRIKTRRLLIAFTFLVLSAVLGLAIFSNQLVDVVAAYTDNDSVNVDLQVNPLPALLKPVLTVNVTPGGNTVNYSGDYLRPKSITVTIKNKSTGAVVDTIVYTYPNDTSPTSPTPWLFQNTLPNGSYEANVVITDGWNRTYSGGSDWVNFTVNGPTPIPTPTPVPTPSPKPTPTPSPTPTPTPKPGDMDYPMDKPDFNVRANPDQTSATLDGVYWLPVCWTFDFQNKTTGQVITAQRCIDGWGTYAGKQPWQSVISDLPAGDYEVRIQAKNPTNNNLSEWSDWKAFTLRPQATPSPTPKPFNPANAQIGLKNCALVVSSSGPVSCVEVEAASAANSNLIERAMRCFNTTESWYLEVKLSGGTYNVRVREVDSAGNGISGWGRATQVTVKCDPTESTPGGGGGETPAGGVGQPGDDFEIIIRTDRPIFTGNFLQQALDQTLYTLATVGAPLLGHNLAPGQFLSLEEARPIGLELLGIILGLGLLGFLIFFIFFRRKITVLDYAKEVEGQKSGLYEALVRAHDEENKVIAEVKTNRRGKARLKLPKGSYRFTVHYYQYQLLSRTELVQQDARDPDFYTLDQIYKLDKKQALKLKFPMRKN